jgi:hypothetical protein
MSMIWDLLFGMLRGLAGMVIDRIGWGGVVALLAGAILLLSLSARMLKAMTSRRGLAVTAGVVAFALVFLGWGSFGRKKPKPTEAALRTTASSSKVAEQLVPVLPAMTVPEPNPTFPTVSIAGPVVPNASLTIPVQAAPHATGHTAHAGVGHPAAHHTRVTATHAAGAAKATVPAASHAGVSPPHPVPSPLAAGPGGKQPTPGTLAGVTPGGHGSGGGGPTAKGAHAPAPPVHGGQPLASGGKTPAAGSLAGSAPPAPAAGGSDGNPAKGSGTPPPPAHAGIVVGGVNQRVHNFTGVAPSGPSQTRAQKRQAAWDAFNRGAQFNAMVTAATAYHPAMGTVHPGAMHPAAHAGGVHSGAAQANGLHQGLGHPGMSGMGMGQPMHNNAHATGQHPTAGRR